jgi:hypothetical protein
MSGASYLRIVWDRDNPATMPQREYREPVQLELLPSDNLLLFSEDANLSADILLELLSNVKPHVILDFRSCPRFDFPGYSRRRAFYDFASWGVHYVVPATSTNIIGATSRVLDTLSKVGIPDEKFVGPILVLVDSDKCIDAISSLMPKVGGKDWEVAIEKTNSGD